MGRPRRDWGPETDARFRSLLESGASAQAILDALVAEGVRGISRATICRRMREVRGHIRPPRPRNDSAANRVDPALLTAPPLPPDSSPDSGAPLPDRPEKIPEGAPVTQLDRWIRDAEAAIEAAKASGNVPLIGQMLRVAAQLAETRRKATPEPPPDPNSNPDMIAAAKRCREELHKLVKSAVEGK